MIDTDCPGCGHQLHIGDEDPNSKGVCGYCGYVFGHNKVPDSDTTSLSGLTEDLDNPEPVGNSQAGGMSPKAVPPRISSQTSELSPLGYGRWVLIFLFPPLGFLLSLPLPSKHPERAKALATSLGMIVVGVGLFFYANSLIKEDLNAQYTFGFDTNIFQEEMTFQEETEALFLAGPNEAILSKVKVPTILGVEFKSIAPYGLTNGPFAHEDISGLKFYSGNADESYGKVKQEYGNALRASGWLIDRVDDFSMGAINTTDFIGTFKAKAVFLQIIESNEEVKVTFVTRHER